MRVTTQMIASTTLNALNKNMSSMDRLFTQLSTGKKIQNISDNPIIASKSLKLKTSILETTQYTDNAKEAGSWMECSETALNNMTEILKEIRTKSVKAANGLLTEADQAMIKNDIEQLWEQLKDEANVTYNGHYMFTGFKTNQPLILDKDMTLEQEVTVGKKGMSIASGTVLGKDSEIAEGSKLGAGTTLAAGSKLTEDTQLTKGTVLQKGTVLKEGTVLDKLDAEKLGFAVLGDTYTITAADGDKIIDEAFTLKGTCTLGADCEIAEGTILGGNTTLGKDSVLAEGTVLNGATHLTEGSVLAVGTKLPKGSLNPIVHGNIEGQNKNYQVGISNTININVLGVDELYSDMMRCMEEIFAIADNAETLGGYDHTDVRALFEQKIEELDGLLAEVAKMSADLGSRMTRLDYIQSRLADDKTSYKQLLSNVEDVDMEEAYMEFSLQYSAYTAALQASSKVLVNTLADYL